MKRTDFVAEVWFFKLLMAMEALKITDDSVSGSAWRWTVKI
jgi:hypothetical protein